MLSPRVAWGLAIGAGLLGGLLLLAAPLLLATSTVTVELAGGPSCDGVIERAGEPAARWNATVSDGARFTMPIPPEVGQAFAYRVEVLGGARIAHDIGRAPWLTSLTVCKAYEGAAPAGERFVGQGEGALYAAFWRM